jgi:hypothetical protein
VKIFHDELTQHAHERAVLGCSWLRDLSHELERRLIEAGPLDRRIAVAAAANVARACSLIAWTGVTMAASTMPIDLGGMSA